MQYLFRFHSLSDLCLTQISYQTILNLMMVQFHNLYVTFYTCICKRCGSWSAGFIRKPSDLDIHTYKNEIT